jgi:hypothetical protein
MANSEKLPARTEPEDKDKDNQLELFREFQLGAAHFTRSIPQIDVLPFFFISRRNEVDPETRVADIKMRRHEFQSGQERIAFEVAPAQLSGKGKKDSARMIFPGEREQLVATTIRSLAVRGAAKLGTTEGNSGIPDSKKRQLLQVTVAFNVRQVRAELESTDHTFSHAEIMEALDILSRSPATLTRSREGETPIDETFTYYSSHMAQGDKRLVTLNRFESQLILSGAYRAIRYDRLMALDDPIARWLFLFVHSEFRNVPSPSSGKRVPYDITLQDMFDRGVLVPPKELRKAILRVRAAFDLLSKAGHLDIGEDRAGYEEIIHKASTGGRRKIVGATWRYYPSTQDANEMIDAHSEAKMRKPEYVHVGADRRLQMTAEVRTKMLNAPKAPLKPISQTS